MIELAWCCTEEIHTQRRFSFWFKLWHFWLFLYWKLSVYGLFKTSYIVLGLISFEFPSWTLDESFLYSWILFTVVWPFSAQSGGRVIYFCSLVYNALSYLGLISLELLSWTPRKRFLFSWNVFTMVGPLNAQNGGQNYKTILYNLFFVCNMFVKVFVTQEKILKEINQV